jgi:hypothetical protein
MLGAALYEGGPETYNQSLINKDWRLTCYPNQPDWGELFDLAADPGEHCNLYHNPKFTPVREELSEQLQRDYAPAPDAGGKSIATY